MKKWLFVISPGCMLAVFLVFYLANRADEEKREQAHQTELARQKQEADDKKARAEQKAHEDAIRRDQERQAEEAKTAKDKQDKYDAEMAKIQADTDRSNAAADTYSKQVSELTIQLDDLHKQKDTLERENFDVAKRVALAEINRRSADMEIQRMVEEITTRADASAMAQMPPPPPAPKE